MFVLGVFCLLVFLSSRWIKPSAVSLQRTCTTLNHLPPASPSPSFSAPPPPHGLAETWPVATVGQAGRPDHPSPEVSKGRELKGGEDRERGTDAEERHQFSIPQRLQIFTLVFFPPLPSWKGEEGPSTSKEKLSRCREGLVI